MRHFFFQTFSFFLYFHEHIQLTTEIFQLMYNTDTAIHFLGFFFSSISFQYLLIFSFNFIF